MSAVLALALALQGAAPAVPPLPAPGARIAWELVLEEPDGRLYIDPASVRRDGNVVRFNTRMAGNVDIEGIRTLFTRQAMDCVRHTSGFEAGATYDAEGRATGSREVAPWEVVMVPIEAQSAEAAFHQRLCGATTA